ncbi:MAG: hypothetical protein JKX97_09145 [Candidatus Lindowbacteria bacterium]|nr:hypothetical protein [Candidatus Lindowbacteria bacterium]
MDPVEGAQQLRDKVDMENNRNHKTQNKIKTKIGEDIFVSSLPQVVLDLGSLLSKQNFARNETEDAKM